MEVELKIDPTCANVKVVIHTKEMTPEVAELIQKLSEFNDI